MIVFTIRCNSSGNTIALILIGVAAIIGSVLLRTAIVRHRYLPFAIAVYLHIVDDVLSHALNSGVVSAFVSI